jgi:predicted  nucleic acid-binding Zn-ribbon protein
MKSFPSLVENLQEARQAIERAQQMELEALNNIAHKVQITSEYVQWTSAKSRLQELQDKIKRAPYAVPKNEEQGAYSDVRLAMDKMQERLKSECGPMPPNYLEEIMEAVRQMVKTAAANPSLRR